MNISKNDVINYLKEHPEDRADVAHHFGWNLYYEYTITHPNMSEEEKQSHSQNIYKSFKDMSYWLDCEDSELFEETKASLLNYLKENKLESYEQN